MQYSFSMRLDIALCIVLMCILSTQNGIEYTNFRQRKYFVKTILINDIYDKHKQTRTVLNRNASGFDDVSI